MFGGLGTFSVHASVAVTTAPDATSWSESRSPNTAISPFMLTSVALGLQDPSGLDRPGW
jgi:hypothetical protein